MAQERLPRDDRSRNQAPHRSSGYGARKGFAHRTCGRKLYSPWTSAPPKSSKLRRQAGAYNAPLEELISHYIDLPKGKKIVVYDRIEERAKQAAAKLKTDGFNAAELAYGLAGWSGRGNKLVTK